MKINFTKKQYLTLMKLVYLGNWVANANRTDDKLKDYESMEDYIFSQAKDFELGHYVDHEEEDGERYFPTNDFEMDTGMQELIDDYDNESFWDDLVDRMGERDFFRKYKEDEIKKMDRKERFIKRMECEEKYENEVDESGLENFEIKK